MRVDHDHPSNMERSWDLYRNEIQPGPGGPVHPAVSRHRANGASWASWAAWPVAQCFLAHVMPRGTGPSLDGPVRFPARAAKATGPRRLGVFSLACLIIKG